MSAIDWMILSSCVFPVLRRELEHPLKLGRHERARFDRCHAGGFLQRLQHARGAVGHLLLRLGDHALGTDFGSTGLCWPRRRAADRGAASLRDQDAQRVVGLLDGRE